MSIRRFSSTLVRLIALSWAIGGLVGCGPAPANSGDAAGQATEAVAHTAGHATAHTTTDTANDAVADTAAGTATLQVQGAWARPGFAGGNSAIYLTLLNGGDSDDRLIGVETAIARAAEIHESEMKDNIMHMHPVAGVAIPAGGRAELAPGGLHVMLVDLQQALADGDTIEVTLTFEQAPPQQLEVPISIEGLGQWSESDFNGLLYDPIEPAPSFELVDQHQQPVQLSDLRGNLVLLYFGFTNCPDACPITLATWNQVHRALGADADRVRFVFITVDPERDTPEIIGKHLALFNEDFIGLWGPLDEIEEIARSYNVYLQKVEVDSAVDYLVNHATLTFVIDAQGRRVLAHPLDTPADEMIADLQTLLH